MQRCFALYESHCHDIFAAIHRTAAVQLSNKDVSSSSSCINVLLYRRVDKTSHLLSRAEHFLFPFDVSSPVTFRQCWMCIAYIYITCDTKRNNILYSLITTTGSNMIKICRLSVRQTNFNFVTYFNWPLIPLSESFLPYDHSRIFDTKM